MKVTFIRDITLNNFNACTYYLTSHLNIREKIKYLIEAIGDIALT